MLRLETHIIHIIIHLYDKSDSELSHDQIVVHKPLTATSDNDLLQKMQTLQQELNHEYIARVQDPKDKLIRFRLELSAQQSPVFTVTDNRGLQLGSNQVKVNT